MYSAVILAIVPRTDDDNDDYSDATPRRREILIHNEEKRTEKYLLKTVAVELSLNLKNYILDD
jgi:hypothetical protein